VNTGIAPPSGHYHFLSNSLFVNDANIRRYIALSTDRLVEYTAEYSQRSEESGSEGHIATRFQTCDLSVINDCGSDKEVAGTNIEVPIVQVKR
jgi:hypothetical protein